MNSQSSLLVALFTLFHCAAGILECNGRTYYWANPRYFVCCGSRPPLYKVNRHVTCCGTKTYNPKSQMCCGGTVSKRSDVNAGCCHGQPFQRGVELCCGEKVIDIETQACCRNVPFDKRYEACCEGVKTPNLDFERNRNPVCCGRVIINPREKLCCAGEVVPNIAGIFTRCCRNQSYDSRKSYCCNRVLPRVFGHGGQQQQCCAGKMMDPRKYICCGYGPVRRVSGENNGCCKLSMYEYVMYDRNTRICCGGKLMRKLPNSAVSACCINKVYDIRRQLCCNEEIYMRKPGVEERCCRGGPYDRNKVVCCGGTLYSIGAGGRRYTFCCGNKGYDRREHECRYISGQGYQLFSLNKSASLAAMWMS